MADRQVRIDLVATDDASPVIDDVAKAAGELEQLDPTVTVAADTSKAERSVDDLLATVTKLDDDDATIVLALRAGRVQNDLTDLLADIETLDASDPTVDVKLSQAADARADLDKLETQIKEINDVDVSPKVDTSGVEHFTGEAGKARDATHSFVGNALTELPGVGTAFGPLSETVSQMTEGILAGEVAMGEFVAAAGPIAAVTIAIKLVNDHFAANKKRAEEAKKAVDDWTKALDDANGVTLDAINSQLRNLIRTNTDFAESVADTNDQFGFTAKDLADALNGDVSPALKRVADLARDYKKAKEDVDDLTGPDEQEAVWRKLGDTYGYTTDQVKKLGPEAVTLTNTMDTQGASLDTATTAAKNQRDALGGLTDSTKDQQDAAKDLTTATHASRGEIDYLTAAVDKAKAHADLMKDRIDALRGSLDFKTAARHLEEQLGGAILTVGANAKVSMDDVDNMKQSIINLGETAGKTDIEIQTELEKVDKGQFDQVYRDVATWSANQPVPIDVQLRLTRQAQQDFRNAASAIPPVHVGVGPQSTPASSAPVLNVTQVFPRGFRASSVLEEARAAARRSGGLYRVGSR